MLTYKYPLPPSNPTMSCPGTYQSRYLIDATKKVTHRCFISRVDLEMSDVMVECYSCMSDMVDVTMILENHI